MGAIGFAAQTRLVLFLVFYMLASGDRYKLKLIEIAGPSRFRKRLTLGILNSITAQVERFLLARAFISATVGAATGVALNALGLSQPIMWGIAAGVLNNIPYVGPSVVTGYLNVGRRRCMSRRTRRSAAERSGSTALRRFRRGRCRSRSRTRSRARSRTQRPR